jgi:hypothetical protein
MTIMPPSNNIATSHKHGPVVVDIRWSQARVEDDKIVRD